MKKARLTTLLSIFCTLLFCPTPLFSDTISNTFNITYKGSEKIFAKFYSSLNGSKDEIGTYVYDTAKTEHAFYLWVYCNYTGNGNSNIIPYTVTLSGNRMHEETFPTATLPYWWTTTKVDGKSTVTITPVTTTKTHENYSQVLSFASGGGILNKFKIVVTIDNNDWQNALAGTYKATLSVTVSPP